MRYPGFGFLDLLRRRRRRSGPPRRDATETVENATSLGGIRSKLESRHRWEGERCPEGLLRLSIGLEDAEVLWADLDQALARA